MACMTPFEIVFVTMPATTDFTGPIIGIVGVLIGSAIGFSGLWWQHNAQRRYDIRKIAANLLAAGEELRDDYGDAKNNGRRLAQMDKILAAADTKLNEMYRHQRHLELVAKPNVADAAETYLAASGVYHKYTRSLFGDGSQPSDAAVDESYGSWNQASATLKGLLNKKQRVQDRK